MSKKFYTPQEVADLLNVKVVTVWDYIRTGKLDAIKLTARTYRVTEEMLKQFLSKKGA